MLNNISYKFVNKEIFFFLHSYKLLLYHYIKEEGSTYPYSPTIIAAKIETSSGHSLKYACNFRLGRVKTTLVNDVYIYTPCYDVNVNPVVLG